MKELDLRNTSSCSDNPVSYLIKLLDEGAMEEFAVIVKKKVIPFEFAKFLAERKSYEAHLVEDTGEDAKILLRKKK